MEKPNGLINLPVLLLILLLVSGLGIGCGSSQKTTGAKQKPATQSTEVSKPVSQEKIVEQPSAQKAALPKTQPLQKVVIGLPRKDISFLPLLVALNSGLFAQEGIELEITEMKSDTLMAALTRGDITFSGAASSAMRAAAQGMPIRAIAFGLAKTTFSMLTVPEVKQIQQLKGKAIGVTNLGSSTHTAAQRALESVGLDYDKDVTYVAVGGGAQGLAALEAGSIQAVMLNPDEAARLEERGFNNLVSMEELMPTPFGGLATSLDTIANQRPLIKSFIRALIGGIMLTVNERTKTEAIAAQEFNLTPAQAKRAVELTVRAIDRENLGGATERGMQMMVANEIAKPLEMDPTKLKVEDLVDFSLLSEVQREMGLRK